MINKKMKRDYCFFEIVLLLLTPMNIKTYLKQEKLTQAAFAQKIGVSQGMVAHWVNGRCRITPEKAIHIDKATGSKLSKESLCPEIFGEIA